VRWLSALVQDPAQGWRAVVGRPFITVGGGSSVPPAGNRRGLVHYSPEVERAGELVSLRFLGMGGLANQCPFSIVKAINGTDCKTSFEVTSRDSRVPSN